jgi:formiminotetrahydrofolate cyclodeaminase
LELVDEEAVAFRAYLSASHGSAALEVTGERAATIPLDIGRACTEVVEVAGAVAQHVRGSTRLDVAAAMNIARAAARSAVDIAEKNLANSDSAERRTALRAHIDRLRDVAIK